ncbi:unnamed protein product [Leptidea sinapis]|uniref:Uncharacterized protein n=1 Tax=Leptidea sinapis TaxID=189913 RepID=A0A5E4QX03_9NEOP|nr:unnamed protein product [Leptidea sinapis]
MKAYKARQIKENPIDNHRKHKKSDAERAREYRARKKSKTQSTESFNILGRLTNEDMNNYKDHTQDILFIKEEIDVEEHELPGWTAEWHLGTTVQEQAADVPVDKVGSKQLKVNLLGLQDDNYHCDDKEKSDKNIKARTKIKEDIKKVNNKGIDKKSKKDCITRCVEQNMIEDQHTLARIENYSLNGSIEEAPIFVHSSILSSVICDATASILFMHIPQSKNFHINTIAITVCNPDHREA